jgi:hypothetical protein
LVLVLPMAAGVLQVEKLGPCEYETLYPEIVAAPANCDAVQLTGKEVDVTVPVSKFTAVGADGTRDIKLVGNM